MPAPANRPYESPRIQAAMGPALRPGGLDVTQHALDACGFSPGDRVLDLGCGMGATVDLLASRNLAALGIDRSPGMLDAARSRHPRTALLRADASALPLRSESLDGTFCECVLSLLPAPDRALAEIHRVLVAGGRAAVSDLYLCSGNGPGSLNSARGCLAGARPRDEWERLFDAARFSVTLWEEHTEMLKEFAARLVFAGVGLDAFFRSSCDGSHTAFRQARPGYALWILKKS